jgi:hypothetical protein
MSIQRSGGKSGGLTYREYVAAAMCKRLPITDERVILAFNALDIGGYNSERMVIR